MFWFFFFSSRRRHTRCSRDWSSDVCSSDLFIGNDWKKKGLDCLLQALAHLKGLPLRLVVVGSDDPALYRSVVEQLQLQTHIRFEKPVQDVLRFYAAADLYVAPSLEDAFNLRSEEHTSELQSRLHLVCRLLLEKKKK